NHRHVSHWHGRHESTARDRCAGTWSRAATGASEPSHGNSGWTECHSRLLGSDAGWDWFVPDQLHHSGGIARGRSQRGRDSEQRLLEYHQTERISMKSRFFQSRMPWGSIAAGFLLLASSAQAQLVISPSTLP